MKLFKAEQLSFTVSILSDLKGSLFLIFKKRKIKTPNKQKNQMQLFSEPEAASIKAKIFSLFGVHYFSLNETQKNFKLVDINAQSHRIVLIGKFYNFPFDFQIYGNKVLVFFFLRPAIFMCLSLYIKATL